MSTLIVESPSDWAAARPGLDELAALNSHTVDLTHEALLPHASVWIAHQGNLRHPLAYALTWLVADEVQLIDLATRPESRRQGAARALLSAVIRNAQASGKAALFLEVRCSNKAALALYQSFGFEVMRVRRGYYADGEDGLEMRCRL